MDLSDVFSDTSAEVIRLAEWDDHPNALGHRMIADRLLKELTRTDNPLSESLHMRADGAAQAR